MPAYGCERRLGRAPGFASGSATCIAGSRASEPIGAWALATGSPTGVHRGESHV